MSNPNAPTDKKQPQEAKGKRAAGMFPRVPLSKVLDLAEAMYAEGQGERVRRLDAFHRLGKSPESGPSRMLVSTGNSGYGLLTGSYQADYLGFTERGRKVMEAGNEVEKRAAIYDSLFANSIFSAFVTRFKDKTLPTDKVAMDVLESELGVPHADVELCWEVIRDNINDFGLIQEVSGKQLLVSRDMALERLGKSLGQQTEPSIDTTPSQVQETHLSIRAPKFSAPYKSPTPEFHFNIQIHLPENASPETYEAIFRSIANNLLPRPGNEE